MKKKRYFVQKAFLLLVFLVGLLPTLPIVAEEDTVTSRYTAIEDTYVDKSKADADYSAANPLKAKYTEKDTSTGYRAAYIKFAIPDIQAGQSVKLQLWARINDSSAGDDAVQK